MGLSVSDAVRILLKRVVNDQAFPLELKVPNAQSIFGCKLRHLFMADIYQKLKS